MATKKKHKKNISQGKQNLKQEESFKPPVKKTLIRGTAIIPGGWKINGSIFLFFVISTLVLFNGDTHIGFFNLDDPKYVINNPWIQHINFKNIGYILSHSYFANYSPMHLFSYMIDSAIGGNSAFTFHLSSNIWAGIVAGFVYLVALALTQKRIVAIIAAGLFVVHPLHVEAIAWISSRKDLVAAAFILPSFLAYLYYRTNKVYAKRWYAASLILFVFALSGKLSVAAFPAVLVAHDLFITKRSLLRSLVDKLPFLIAAIIFTIAVTNAQPSTGSHIELGVTSKSFFESIWLLTGFGNYVIYRVPPSSENNLLGIIGLIGLLVILFLPLLLRKRFPLIVVLIYWIIFTYLPTQALSFVNPVTDRYLFLPSVAACILIALAIMTLGEWISKWKLIIPIATAFIIAILWTKNTLNYLNEWKDPRSVWYAVTKKSSDVQAYYNLGLVYKDKAAQLGSNRKFSPLPSAIAKKFASVVWRDDPQLPALLNELDLGKHNGPIEDSFQKYVRIQALNYLDTALKKKGDQNIPDLFYYKGQLLLDMGDPKAAKNEFLKGIDETMRIKYVEWQQEMLVRFHAILSDTDFEMGNVQDALHWVKQAEEEQIKFGGNWFPNLTNSRKELEHIIDSLKVNNQNP